MKQELLYPRKDERSFDEIRSINVQVDTYGYATASVLLEIGLTKVLASISLQTGVPQFLKGQRTGWLTAEYAMLPCATRQRTNRDSSQMKSNARSIEISRIIGRAFRSVVDMNAFPDKTIYIDCDVLQADGGTRVACITAASLAFMVAVKRWQRDGIIKTNILREPISAISVGMVNANPCLDLTQEEDNAATADWNFVITQSGKLIEIQGTAEKQPISCDEFEQLKKLALKGSSDFFARAEQLMLAQDHIKRLFESKMVTADKEQRAGLFSIASRVTF